jgi:hypothetical protein
MENDLLTEKEIEVKIKIKWDNFGKCGIINDYKINEQLRKEYNIIGEGTGTLKSSRKQNKVLTAPFLISKYDTAFLLEK